MHENLIANLTSKDDKYACAIADRIIFESQDTDEWYEYFDTFVLQKEHAVYIKAAGFNIIGFEHEIVTRKIVCDGLRVTKSYAYRADNQNPLIPIFLEMAKR